MDFPAGDMQKLRILEPAALDPKPTLSLRGGSRYSCPLPPVRDDPAPGWSRSNPLWAALNNAEGRLKGRGRHIVGHYRLGKTFEGERAKLLNCDTSLECNVDALAE